MISDAHSEFNSPSIGTRLPSLMALRCFEAAARLEHFSRAADELHLTHGAVSRAVRLLEEELGVALFERRQRRVYLTDTGRTLAQAVSSGFGLMQSAVQTLRASAQNQRDVLSCEPTLLMRWLIPRWPDFQARYPQAKIHLVAGGGAFSFAEGIDLAIRRNDFLWPDSYHVQLLFAEHMGPVCRPDKAAQWFGRPARKRLRSTEVPMLHTRTRPHAWKDWSTLTAQQLPQGPEHYFEHFYFSLQACVAGLGVAMAPWHLVCDDLRSGLLTAPLGFVDSGAQYALFSPHAIPAGSLHAQLLEWLREMAAQSAPGVGSVPVL